MTSMGNGAAKSATTSNSSASRDRVEEAADDLADHRLERGDGAGREHAADERAEPVVLGRVHHDDAAEARDELGVAFESVDSSMPCALENPCQSRCAVDDVGEARQRVEPVLLAVVDGRLVAQSPVHLARVVEVLVRERIELDGLSGHGLVLLRGRGVGVRR